MKLSELIRNKKVYIISPHFDDAALSCYRLMSEIPDAKQIVVINIFTKGSRKPYTFSAKKNLKDSGGYRNAIALYKQRTQEDKRALSSMRVLSVNLGIPEALFRKKRRNSILGRLIPEMNHYYPTYRWHVVKKVHPNDPAISQLKKKLRTFTKEKALFIVPFGIGNHADHLIARTVCAQLCKNIVYYADFPYSAISENRLNTDVYQKIGLSPRIRTKNQLLKLYKSQYNSLFPKGKIPNHKEVYFCQKT